jgi:hypothetical protein
MDYISHCWYRYESTVPVAIIPVEEERRRELWWSVVVSSSRESSSNERVSSSEGGGSVILSDLAREHRLASVPVIVSPVSNFLPSFPCSQKVFSAFFCLETTAEIELK